MSHLETKSKKELLEILEEADKAMGELVSELHKEFCFSGLATEKQWNESISPKLEELCLTLEGYEKDTPTARVYKFPHIY